MLKACVLWAQSQAPAAGAGPQQQLASPFAATVQRALTGSLFDGRDVPLTKLTRQLSINLAESRARGSLKHPAKSGAGLKQADLPVYVGSRPDGL